MKIVIDARMLYATGIGRYAHELLEQLQTLDHTNTYSVIIRPQDRALWQPFAPNFKAIELDAPIYSLAEQTKLARLLRQLNPDLVHFLNFNSPIAYRGRRVTTVHDLTLLDFSVARGSVIRRAVYKLKRVALRFQFRRVLQRSTAIITDTAFVRGQLIARKLAPTKRVTAIHIGLPPLHNHQPQALAVKTPFLLYVGNFYPYKNLGRLVEALAQLQVNHPDLRLVLVGSEDSFGAELRRVASELKEGSVIFTGFVSDAELAWLYQHAELYVFPSLSEGFGLPGLEAMSYGLPVASSNATCLPEVYGDAAVYFDPTNSGDIARVVGDLLADPKKLAALKNAGLDRVKQYSWRRMAEQTLAVYQKALSESSHE
jgi:glycosyltransferase involved in cell wall biosynthesis